MKKFLIAVVALVFVVAFSGISFAGGYETKSSEYKEEAAAPAATCAPAVSAAPCKSCATCSGPGCDVGANGAYNENDMNKNLGGMGETLVNAGKTTGCVLTGFFRECGTVIEGAGKTTGEMLFGAAKTTGVNLKGAADQTGRMTVGAGETTTKTADTTGKVVAGEVKEECASK